MYKSNNKNHIHNIDIICPNIFLYLCDCHQCNCGYCTINILQIKNNICKITNTNCNNCRCDQCIQFKKSCNSIIENK